MLLSNMPNSCNTLIRALKTRPEANSTVGTVKGKPIDKYKSDKGFNKEIQHLHRDSIVILKER